MYYIQKKHFEKPYTHFFDLVNIVFLVHYISMEFFTKRYKKLFRPFFFIMLFFLSSFLSAHSRPIAMNISAIAKGVERIRLAWEFDSIADISSLLVFRSKKTISTSQDLLLLKPIATLDKDANIYDDVFENGEGKKEEFYYAVIAQLKDGSTYNVVLPSINATVNPVCLLEPKQTKTLIEKEEKAQRLYMEGELREQPLPYMQKTLPNKELEDSKTAAENVKNMFPLSAAKEKKKLSPFIFRDDTKEVKTGDDYLLQAILKRTFFKSDYKKASEELTQFLGVNREKGAADRSYFYLGECYYFSGDYEKALSYFLHTQSIYPELTRKWATYTLNEYQIPKHQP